MTGLYTPTKGSMSLGTPQGTHVEVYVDKQGRRRKLSIG